MASPSGPGDEAASVAGRLWLTHDGQRLWGSGEIDLSVIDDFGSTFGLRRQRRRPVDLAPVLREVRTVELKAVTFADATLSELIWELAHTRATLYEPLTIRGASPQVRLLLEITEIAPLVNLVG